MRDRLGKYLQAIKIKKAMLSVDQEVGLANVRVTQETGHH